MLDGYIQKYGKRLFGLCLTLCANGPDAEDLYQDTWLKVLRHWGRYDEAKEFEPWLTAICVNTYRDRLRRLQRLPLFRELPEELAAPEQTDYSDLHRAIDRLPEKLRITVILFYFHDMKESQVAESLGIPPGTVKSRLNNARKILRKELSDEEHL